MCVCERERERERQRGKNNRGDPMLQDMAKTDKKKKASHLNYGNTKFLPNISVNF